MIDGRCLAELPGALNCGSLACFPLLAQINQPWKLYRKKEAGRCGVELKKKKSRETNDAWGAEMKYKHIYIPAVCTLNLYPEDFYICALEALVFGIRVAPRCLVCWPLAPRSRGYQEIWV